MSRRDDVWANEDGTPGMPIVKIERGSEAWQHLLGVLVSDYAYLRISAADGHFKLKAGEGIWTYQLDVEADKPRAEMYEGPTGSVVIIDD